VHISNIYAGLVQGVKDLFLALPISSAFRPYVTRFLVNSSRPGTLKEQCAAINVSSRSVYRHRALDEDEVQSVVTREAGTKGYVTERKKEGTLDMVREFWLACCRMSRQTDSTTGERRPVYYCPLPYEEVYRRYKAFMVATLRRGEEGEETKDGEEMEVGEAAAARTPVDELFFEHHELFNPLTADQEDGAGDVWDDAFDETTYLRRAAFLFHRPVEVQPGVMSEFKCPLCRSLAATEDRWDWLKERHELAHRMEGEGSEEECDREGCTLWSDALAVVGWSAEDFERSAKDIEEGLAHVEVVNEQRKEFMRVRASLTSRTNGSGGGFTVAVVMDFSSYPKAVNRNRSLGESIGIYQALHAVVYRKNHKFDSTKEESTANRPYTREVFDFFGCEKNDSFFVRRAVLELGVLAELQGESVYFWSDGGPKHFMNCRSLFFIVVELKARFKLVRCVWAFFAANHGKNECDTAAAYVKSTLRRLAVRGRPTSGQWDYAAVANTLNHHNAMPLGKFIKDELFDVDQVRGVIRVYRYFEFDEKVNVGAEEFTLTCKFLSNDSDDATTNGELTLKPLFKMNMELLGEDLDALDDDTSLKEEKKRRKEQEEVEEAVKRPRRIEEMMVEGTRVVTSYELEGRKNKKWYGATVLKSEEREKKDGGKSWWGHVKFDDEGAKNEWIDLTDGVKLEPRTK